MDICEILKNMSYPGRGIAVGRTPGGDRAVLIYFLTGRSSNSRNRVFEADEDGVLIRPFDESKVEDPSLIIYRPLSFAGETVVLTNGDHTDTIVDGIRNGISPVDSLMTRTYEPDAPIYTPRISAVLTEREGEPCLLMSEIRRTGEGQISRSFFDCEPLERGEGRFICTYNGDGAAPESYEGEPAVISIPDAGIDEIARSVWDSLDADNKVSLLVCFRGIGNGGREIRIINKNKGL